jgi:uncharacterized Rmd1/YagE family protein
MSDTPLPSIETPAPRRVTIRALLLGERIDAAGLERPDMISSTPLAFLSGAAGYVAIYRFGVAVTAGLSPLEEEDVLSRLDVRVVGKRARVDDETAILDIAFDHEDRIPPGGPIELMDLSAARFLVVADALAKTVSLARDEREVARVFDRIEPFAANLAAKGRPPWDRRSMLRLIGQALLLQQRVSGRIAVDEKPDILWDRPDLERLYARLGDEYELPERADALQNKIDVVVEASRILTDVLDTDRATRLEATIVILIVMEILVTLYQMFFLHAAK